MSFYLVRHVQNGLVLFRSFTIPPKNPAANGFPSLTKHTFFAMLKKTKGDP
jgi:hypothetical protein